MCVQKLPPQLDVLHKITVKHGVCEMRMRLDSILFIGNSFFEI